MITDTQMRTVVKEMAELLLEGFAQAEVLEEIEAEHGIRPELAKRKFRETHSCDMADYVTQKAAQEAREAAAVEADMDARLARAKEKGAEYFRKNFRGALPAHFGRVFTYGDRQYMFIALVAGRPRFNGLAVCLERLSVRRLALNGEHLAAVSAAEA